MGKKNSKLKGEVVARLAKETYCEYMSNLGVPSAVENTVAWQTPLVRVDPYANACQGPSAYESSWNICTSTLALLWARALTRRAIGAGSAAVEWPV